MRERRLSRQEHERVARAREQLVAFGVDERPLLAMARALGMLAPRALGFVHRWREGGRAGEVGYAAEPSFRAYADHPSGAGSVEGLVPKTAHVIDPFRCRAVDLDTLFAHEQERIRAFRETLLIPAGAIDQVRVNVGDRDVSPLGCCLLFERGVERNVESEVACLQALTPSLHDAYQCLHAIGSQTVDLDGAVRATSMLAQPAWLTTSDGQTVFQNTAASRAFAVTPAYVRGVPRASLPPDLCGARSMLRLGDTMVSLTLIRTTPRTANQSLAALPPALREVAILAAQGLADEEIAEQSQRTVATVRTYVRRACTRLQVAGRSELVARLYGAAPIGSRNAR